MSATRPTLIVEAPPAALVGICGVSLLERLLRNAQRLEFRLAHVISDDADVLRCATADSWARRDIAVAPHGTADWPALLAGVAASQLVLVISAGCYFDARLVEVMAASTKEAVLIDAMEICDGAILRAERLRTFPCRGSIIAELRNLASDGAVGRIDVETVGRYVASLRRAVRPVWFRAPEDPAAHARCEELVLDAAQNGTLDLPALVHAPIETWIIARLCRTRITPNQITLFTAIVSIAVAVLFLFGWLLPGVFLALGVGVLDGLDGKQARVKVETTDLGRREHLLDYILELAWWTALAFHFHATGELGNAFAWLALLVGADWIDRIAKRSAKNRTGRNLDDVAPFDRAVRLIGGRRNIYIWMLAIALLAGAAGEGFIAICSWGAVTAAVHVVRAIQLRRGRRGSPE